MARRRGQSPSVTPEARASFLEAIGAAWSVTEAAKRAGVIRARFYELRQVDEKFKEEWAEADARGADTVRDEIRRRAIDGWDEPIFQQGSLAGYIHRKSDRLLELEAKRRDPEYRDKQQLALTGTWRGELDVGVRVEYDYEAILDGLVEAGVIVRGPAADAALAQAQAIQRKALERKALEPGDDEPPSQPDGEPTP